MLTFFLISNILDILCAKKLDHFCVRNRHQAALAPPQIRVRERKKNVRPSTNSRTRFVFEATDRSEINETPKTPKSE